MPVREKDVDRAIDKAEKGFNRAWSLLVAIKKGKVSHAKPNPVLNFQPVLATSLFELSKAHSRIAVERKFRVSQKARYVPSWFNGRMAFLGRQQTRVIEALQVGRSIGDAFAFFFYQNELQFLSQQVKGQKPGPMSTGIGGIGELQFAKNMRMLGDLFLLHHCVTSLLRLGDVTLIDLRGFRVAGVGELKSHSDKPGHVIVSVSVLSERPEIAPPQLDSVELSESAAMDVVDLLTGAAKDRLKRQMDRIGKSHAAARKKPDSYLSIESENRIDVLGNLLKASKPRRFQYAQAGNGLVLFAYRARSMSLSKRLRKIPGQKREVGAD